MSRVVTARGLSFAWVGASALVVALLSGSFVAGVAGLSLLGALAVAALGSREIKVRAERSVSTDLAREGVPVAISTRVSAEHGSIRGRVRIADPLPVGLAVVRGEAAAELPATATLTLDYEVKGRLPRTFTLGRVVVRSCDPLGLVEHVVRAGEDQALTVLPSIDELREGLSSSGLSRMLSGGHNVGQGGTGSDFYALRGFQEGDTLRDVNWTATARAGGQRLVVNQRERESHALVTYLLDGRRVAALGTVGTNAWVLAARALASMAAANAQGRDRPRLVLYGPTRGEHFEAAPGDPLHLSMMAPLVGGRPEGKHTLLEAVDALAPRLAPKQPLVIVSNLVDDPTVSDAVLRLRVLRARVVVIAIRGPALAALAGYQGDALRHMEAAHEATVAALRAAGARVVDWAPDEPLALAVAREVTAR